MKDPRGVPILPGTFVVYAPSNCVPHFAKVLGLRGEGKTIRIAVADSIAPQIGYHVTIKSYIGGKWGIEPCAAQCLVIKPEGIPDEVMQYLDKQKE
jgi:hypothetical protein